MKKELVATIMPKGNVLLEFVDSNEVGKSQELLQQEIFHRFKQHDFSWLLFLGFVNKDVQLSESLNFWQDFAALFDKKLSQTPDLEKLRHKVILKLSAEEVSHYLNNAPLLTGFEYLNEELIRYFWSCLNKTFSDLIKSYKGSVEEFIHTFSPDVHLIGRVFFHLVENKDHELPFAFLATYSSKIASKGKSTHIPLKHALKESGGDSDKLLDLLSTVHLAARNSDLIFNLLSTGEIFHPLAWNADEAFQFLQEIPIYEKAGLLCRIPNWWKSNRSGLRLDVNIGEEKASYLNKDALLSCNIGLYFGETKISEQEARQLLESSAGLANIKNKWVAVDPTKLQLTLDAYERAKKMTKDGCISLQEAMRLQLQPDKMLGLGHDDAATISHGIWLKSIMQKLTNPNLIRSVKPSKNLKGQLRDYQQKGLNWLYFLHSIQLGACLADDMGLGKTIQILAFLSILKDLKNDFTTLLIVPASLISNWEKEIQRFFPNLKYFIAHPSLYKDKQVKKHNKRSLKALDLVITTYNLASKYTWIIEYCWDYIILDEAQAIKNSWTKQAIVIKKIKSKNRIILTGTPIENKLLDLWSLFDFLNPGLLGSANEFKDFMKGLKEHPDGYAKLRHIITPYVLRRMKTDKTIINDLPDKVEMKTYAIISKKQAVLYQDLINKIKAALKNVKGIHRRGIILSSLVKFKQLCNHPDQYLGTGHFLEKDSGKFIRLREICETIYEKRERVLIFTQFKEMVEPLSYFLEGIFEHKGVVLHGATQVSKRKNIVEKFQGDEYVPFMVLSLKAGGVGLNLTNANHVVHFDRWWNPAVENQATDRAFRIGQTKNVIVHKFLMKGTIEDKIDCMLEDKARLSENIISASSESWITEMKDDQLLDLFKLTKLTL